MKRAKKLTAEQLLATHEERVREARRRRWAGLPNDEDSLDAWATAYGEEPPFRSCPTALERMKAVLRG